mgnify:CR=1 FL=1
MATTAGSAVAVAVAAAVQTAVMILTVPENADVGAAVATATPPPVNRIVFMNNKNARNLSIQRAYLKASCATPWVARAEPSVRLQYHGTRYRMRASLTLSPSAQPSLQSPPLRSLAMCGMAKWVGAAGRVRVTCEAAARAAREGEGGGRAR